MRQPKAGAVWADHLLDEVDVTPAAASLLGVGPGVILAIDFVLAMKLLVSRAKNFEDLPSTFDSLFDDLSEDLDVTLHFADSPTHLQVRAYVCPQSGFAGRLWIFDDVSAANVAGNALEAANEMLRANADSMLDSQVLIEAVRDPAGRVVDFEYRAVNRAACSLMRVHESELVGSRLLQTRGVDTAGLMQWWVQCLQDGQSVQLDDFVFGGGVFGAARHFDIRATRAGVDRLSVTWSEVTERFRAAQRLAASERQYRLLAENAADVVAHIRDGRFVWISPSCEESLGAPPEYWVGRKVVSTIPPEDAPIFAANDSTVMAGGIVSGRVRVISRRGSTHWVHLNAKPLRDDDGRQDGFIASIRLIDEEVAAEQEAQEARRERATADARYRRAMDTAAIGMCLLAPDGTFVEVNPALCEFFGCDAETLTQTTWQKMTPPEFLDVGDEERKAVFDGRLDSYRFVKSYVHADGHRIWADVAVNCIRGGDGQVQHLAAQIIDITDEVHTRERLAQADEQNRLLAQRLQQQNDRLAVELESAAEYIASIMPSGLSGQVEVSSRYLPSQKLGGDCFNYFWFDDDHFIVALIDVSGHGIRPALLAVSVHNLLSSETFSAEIRLAPEIMLAELNRLFPMERHDGNFIAMWYAVYQPSTRTLRYASAGTPPALAFASANGRTVSVMELSKPAPPVGTFEDTAYSSGTYTVPLGCQILAFSDGATELPLAEGGNAKFMDFTDFKSLTTRLVESPDFSIDRLIDQLRAITATGTFTDDCSIIHLTFS